MTTATQKEMIVRLLREGESFLSAAGIMNERHLEPGQRPYSRSAIAGVAFRAGFRKIDHGIPTVRKPPAPRPQVNETQAKPAISATKANEPKKAGATTTGGKCAAAITRKPVIEPCGKSSVPAAAKNRTTAKGRATQENAKTSPKVAPMAKAQVVTPTKGGAVIEWWSKPDAQKTESRGAGPKNIEELDHRDCRWPSKSEPSSDRTSRFYCETPALDGKPYCAYHLSLAHFRSSEKTAA